MNSCLALPFMERYPLIGVGWVCRLRRAQKRVPSSVGYTRRCAMQPTSRSHTMPRMRCPHTHAHRRVFSVRARQHVILKKCSVNTTTRLT